MTQLSSQMTIGVGADTSAADRELRRFNSDVTKAKRILEPLAGVFNKIDKASEEAKISVDEYTIAMGRNQERTEKAAKELNKFIGYAERVEQFKGMGPMQIAEALRAEADAAEKAARATRKAEMEMERLNRLAEKIRLADPRNRMRAETADVNLLQSRGLLGGADAEAEIARIRQRYADAIKPKAMQAELVKAMQAEIVKVPPMLEPPVLKKTAEGIGLTQKAINSMKLSLGQFLGPIALTYTALEGLRKGFEINFEVQRAEASLRAFHGSAKEARRIVTDVRAATGSSSGIVAGLISARTLAQFSGDTGTVAEQVALLNRIAGGSPDRLQNLALAMGQVQAAGRLMGQEVIQFVNAGFNPLLAISQKTGISMAELKARMEAGLVPAQDVIAAVVDAATEGGRFFNMLDERLSSSAGQWDVMKGKAQEFALSLGESVEPFVKNALGSMNVELQNMTKNFNYAREQLGLTGGDPSKPYFMTGGSTTAVNRIFDGGRILGGMAFGNEEMRIQGLQSQREQIGGLFDDVIQMGSKVRGWLGLKNSGLLETLDKFKDARDEIEGLRIKANLLGRGELKQDQLDKLDAANKKAGIYERELEKQNVAQAKFAKAQKDRIDKSFEEVNLDIRLAAVKAASADDYQAVKAILDSVNMSQSEMVRGMLEEGKSLDQIIGKLPPYLAMRAKETRELLRQSTAADEKRKADKEALKDKEREAKAIQKESEKIDERIQKLRAEVGFEREVLSLKKDEARTRQLIAEGIDRARASTIAKLEADKESAKNVQKARQDLDKGIESIRKAANKDSDLIDKISDLRVGVQQGKINPREARALEDKLLGDAAGQNKNSMETPLITKGSNEVAKVIADVQKANVSPQLAETRKQSKLLEINLQIQRAIDAKLAALNLKPMTTLVPKGK